MSEMSGSAFRYDQAQEYGEPFCVDSSGYVFAMNYVNTRRCLPGDKLAKQKNLRGERRNNVVFYWTESPSCVAPSRPYMLLAGRVLPDLEYGEERFVDYGNN